MCVDLQLLLLFNFVPRNRLRQKSIWKATHKIMIFSFIICNCNKSKTVVISPESLFNMHWKFWSLSLVKFFISKLPNTIFVSHFSPFTCTSAYCLSTIDDIHVENQWIAKYIYDRHGARPWIAPKSRLNYYYLWDNLYKILHFIALKCWFKIMHTYFYSFYLFIAIRWALK